VRDSGSESTGRLEHLFHPSRKRRLDRAALRRHRVGPVDAQSLVASHGRADQREERSGQSSTFSFTVTLPLAEEAILASEPSFDVFYSGSAALRILLVGGITPRIKSWPSTFSKTAAMQSICGRCAGSDPHVAEQPLPVILMDVQMPE